MAAFGLFISISLGLLAWTWLRNQPSHKRPAVILGLALALALPLLGWLALSGRLHLLGLLLALGYPFLHRVLPLLRNHLAGRTGQGSGGDQSTVTAEILEMTLDHDSGAMSGRVLQGPLAGRSLEDVEEQEFLDLLHYCRQQDADSARLLETYLDRRFGQSWRADDPDNGQDQAEGQDRDNDEPPHDGELSREDAYAILGLEPGASRDEIIQAHRRLIQKLHPDRGGSAYLASRINAARKRLL